MPFEPPLYARTRPQVVGMRHRLCYCEEGQHSDRSVRELVLPADTHLSGAADTFRPASPPFSAVTPAAPASEPSGWTSPALAHSSAAKVVLGAKWRIPRPESPARRSLAGPFNETACEARLLRRVALRRALRRWIRRNSSRDCEADAGYPSAALPLSIAAWHIHSLDEITCRSNHSLAWLPDVLAGGLSHSLPRSFTLPRRFREWRAWARRVRLLKAQLGYRRALRHWAAGTRDADALHRRGSGGSRQRASLSLRHQWKRWARLSRIRRRACGSLPLLKGAMLRWRSRSRVAFRTDNLRSKRLVSAAHVWGLRQVKHSFGHLRAAVANRRLDRQRQHRAMARASAASLTSAWRALRDRSTAGKAARALCSSAVVARTRSGQRRAWGRLRVQTKAGRWVRAAGLRVGRFQMRRALQSWRSNAADVALELGHNVRCRRARSAIRRWVLLLQARRAFGMRRAGWTESSTAFRLRSGLQRLVRRARLHQMEFQSLSHFTGRRVWRRLAVGWRGWAAGRNRVRTARGQLEVAAFHLVDASTREAWRRVVQRAQLFRFLGTTSRAIECRRVRQAWLRWFSGIQSVTLQAARRMTSSAFWAGSSASRAMIRWQRNQADSLLVLELRGPRTVLPQPACRASEDATLLEVERVRSRVLRHLDCGLPLLSTCTAERLIELRSRRLHSGPPSLMCKATWRGRNAAPNERWPLMSSHPACSEERLLIARPPLVFWRFVHGLVSHAARRTAAIALGRWRSRNRREHRWAAGAKEAMARMMRGWMRAWRSGCVGAGAADLLDRRCKRDAAVGLKRLRAGAALRSLAGRAFGLVAHRTACSRLVRGFFSGFVIAFHESRAKLKVARALGQHEPWRERRATRRALARWVDAAAASTASAQRSILHRLLARQFHGAWYFARWAVVARQQAAASVMAARMADRGRTACLRRWQAGDVRRRASAALAVGCIDYRVRSSLVRCLFNWRIHVHEFQWCVLALSVAQGPFDWDPQPLLALQDSWGP
jgi:hypothetical protein